MLDFDTIHALEAREGLAQLGLDSIDCVLTSPPYWAQRDYGDAAAVWADGWTGALGLEPDFNRYLDHLIEIFDGVQRVLKPTGTLWVNLGDCYAGAWSIGPARRSKASGHTSPDNLSVWSHEANPRSSVGTPVVLPVREKSLCLVPERFAVRMVERGWVLRNHIVWHKPNFLPASVRDRFACSWEHIFFFAKSPRYDFDLDAVRVPHVSPNRAATEPWRKFLPGPHSAVRLLTRPTRHARALHPMGKNPGDCWFIATRGSFGGHPAVFPEQLCERPILAGCPVDGIVLDPFAGSGTTCVAAKRLGRRYLGFEVNPAHAELARLRLMIVEGETKDSVASADPDRAHDAA